MLNEKAQKYETSDRSYWAHNNISTRIQETHWQPDKQKNPGHLSKVLDTSRTKVKNI